MGFFDLPRELRDEIYTHYAAQDGGYLYNQRTRRLRTANGDPIDLSFMQTCSQVAHELRPVIFEKNTVTFRTGWVDRETSDRAASFAIALKWIHIKTAYQLYKVRKAITEDMIEHAGVDFPQCLSLLHRLRGGHETIAPTPLQMVVDWRLWRHPPSTHRGFVKFMLSRGKGTRRWWEFWKDDQVLGQRPEQPNVASLLAGTPDPWMIPNPAEIASLKEQCISSSSSKSDSPIYEDGPIKRYFSAAALAIQFLNGLDPSVLSAVRKIVLDEAHASIAYSECHGLGLVSILQQYPRISIRRQVDTKTMAITSKIGQPYFEQLVDQYHDGQVWDIDGEIERVRVSQAFMRWFEEAVALSSRLSPDRLSLIFHSRNTASTLALLEQMLEDARWQRTLESLAPRPISPLSLLDSCCFFSESFTRVMRGIQQGEGNVRFDIGDLSVCDSNTAIPVDRESTPARVGENWMAHFQGTYVEPSPYAGRKDLLQEYMEDEVQD
ncbi:uncharacterized protein J4E87_003618 [Alternaria ethzedia]|uniref:uncharacterized protein n=2 Tax=Alternaria sect. Infectoriae TaxID=2499258 RepID=UPI0020C4D9AD|nr:uncharacterized protein J4E87_003618 [Alternaria ethzedia]KAI4629354.1 hypothetical protein J4E87_003618 [Alternaria ethzedia]